MKIALNKKVLRGGERVYVAPDSPEDGVFYLSWYEGGKRRREALEAPTLKLAIRARDERQKDEDAKERMKDNGSYVEPVQAKSKRLLLTDAVKEYLYGDPSKENEDHGGIKKNKSEKTLAAYSKALEYFQESCSKTFVDTIERRDMLAFKHYLSDKKGQSDRSVWNKFSAVMGFLKSVDHTGKTMGIVKHDWPEYDEEAVVIYKDAELEKFYKACNEEEARWFRFFEYTGMREGEVQHCQWSWIDLDERTITVQPNKRQDWRPKKNKTRSIPMSTPLYELLKDWKTKADGTCDLVFPTSGCNVKLDFLDCLKTIAERAGLKGDWFLHKFRATFATKVLRKTDVATVREWLGHDDMASTMRYIKAAEGEEARAKMDAVFG